MMMIQMNNEDAMHNSSNLKVLVFFIVVIKTATLFKVNYCIMYVKVITIYSCKSVFILFESIPNYM